MSTDLLTCIKLTSILSPVHQRSPAALNLKLSNFIGQKFRFFYNLSLKNINLSKNIINSFIKEITLILDLPDFFILVRLQLC